MIMAKRNIVAGLVLIALGAWYSYQIGNLPDRSLMPNTPGPSFFPILIVTALLALSLSLLAVGVIELRRAGHVDAGASSGPLQRAPIYALAAAILYLAALPYAGFIVASVPMFAALMYFYGSRNKIMIAISSVLIPVALYIIFRFAFQIVLPRGILEF